MSKELGVGNKGVPYARIVVSKAEDRNKITLASWVVRMVALLTSVLLAFSGLAVSLTIIGIIFGIPMLGVAVALFIYGIGLPTYEVSCPNCDSKIKKISRLDRRCPSCKIPVILTEE